MAAGSPFQDALWPIGFGEVHGGTAVGIGRL